MDEAQTPLYRQAKHLLATSLTALSLLLMLTSVLWPSWLQQTALSGPMTMSLTSCSDCCEVRQHWSWQCFERVHCDMMHHDGLCEFFDRSYRTTMVYGALEFLAVLFNIMLLERFLSFILGRDYGSPRLMRLLSGLVLTCHAIGVATYFIVQGPGFEQNCTYARLPDEMPIQCVQAGPVIALAAGLIQLLMVCQVNYSFSYRDEIRDKGVWIHTPTVYCISLKGWMFGLFFLHICFYLLAIVGLTAMNWVQRSSQAEAMTGGLLRCVNCPLTSGNTVGTR